MMEKTTISYFLRRTYINWIFRLIFVRTKLYYITYNNNVILFQNLTNIVIIKCII